MSHTHRCLRIGRRRRILPATLAPTTVRVRRGHVVIIGELMLRQLLIRRVILFLCWGEFLLLARHWNLLQRATMVIDI